MSFTRTSQQKRVDPYEGNYSEARKIAFNRSNGKCQFCGSKDAEEAHHWALSYPSGTKVSHNDLTALCKTCHNIATSLRALVREGVDRNELDADFESAYEDRQKYKMMTHWIRSSLTANEKYKDSQQGVSVQSVMQVAQLQAQHEVNILDSEIDGEMDRLRRYTRRITWTLFLLAIAIALMSDAVVSNFQYLSYFLNSLLS